MPRQFLTRRVKLLASFCAIGLTTPWLSSAANSLGSPLAWLIDLTTHWQWLYLAGLLFATPIAAFSSKRWALLLLAAPLPWLTASEPIQARHSPGQADQTLTIASANVHLNNQDIRPLQAWLETTHPDVVVLQEVSHAYAAGLASLRDYPYRLVVPKENPFGIAILSRTPLLEAQTVEGAGLEPRIEAKLEWQGQNINIIAFHPMPPISPEHHIARNQQILDIAKQAMHSKSPTIVAGDMNATPWSTAFDGLTNQGLRRVSGLTPSWPAIGRGIVGIPIDQILASGEWKQVSTDVGPNLGSDHLPLLVRLAR